VPSGEQQGLLAVTARVGEQIQRWHYKYERLVIATETLPAREVADRLAGGRVTPATEGPFIFRLPLSHEGTTTWFSSGLDVGMFGPYPTPSMYFQIGIKDGQDRLMGARLDDPVYGPGQPFYLTGREAVMEILFGMTRDQGRRDFSPDILIRQPYRHGHIVEVSYIEGEGLRTVLGETDPDGLKGHELQVAYKMARSESKLTRHNFHPMQAGPYAVALEAEPMYAAVGLVNGNGVLVDSRERTAQPSPYPVADQPLPAQAIPEALDFLNSAWRNSYGRPLWHVRQMAGVAGLALAVGSRSDFESRLTYLADIVKLLEIEDDLLEPNKVGKLKGDATLDRLESALRTKVAEADRAGVQAAVEVLRDVNRMRGAIQHGHARTDLVTLAARLHLPPPPQWSEMWEALRYRLVDAVAEIRRALLATL
jgi:hypothetical protein